jgi:hypothetical protein
MNRKETARCYLLWAAAYDRDAKDATIAGWHAIIGDLDGDEAYEATLELCRSSKHVIRPSEIRDRVLKKSGDLPPDIEAAIGYYLAGEWTVHPLVEKAAKRVDWDRKMMPKEATYQFRAGYTALLDNSDTGRTGGGRRPQVERGGDAQPIGEILAGFEDHGDES